MKTTLERERKLIQCASSFSNMFHGNSTLSSFELARGYSPSKLCVPSSVVPPGLLQAHKQTAASIAVNKLLRSRQNSVLSHKLLPPGTELWIYTMRPSKTNRRDGSRVLLEKRSFISFVQTKPKKAANESSLRKHLFGSKRRSPQRVAIINIGGCSQI